MSVVYFKAYRAYNEGYIEVNFCDSYSFGQPGVTGGDWDQWEVVLRRKIDF